MERRIKEVPSKLAKLRDALTDVLPRGLPKTVARFYSKTDGLKVSYGRETAVLVGLADMFDGVKKGKFRKHVVAERDEIDDLDWTSLPHYGRFFDEHGDVYDEKSVDRLNLRMRLKLLASAAGESTDIGIDFYDGSPTIYVVDRADAAYPLKDVGFDDFVAWFSKFGTRRWYFAFLDKKAEKSMNVDLRDELQRSLEDFPREEWEPLLRRLPKRKAPGPVKVAGGDAIESSKVDRDAFPPLTNGPVVFGAEDRPRQVSFSADGRSLLVWGGNYDLVVYDVGTRKRSWKQKKADSAALSPDGRSIAVLEHTGSQLHAERLVLRDVASGKPLHAKPWRPGVELAAVGWIGGGRVVVADTSDRLHTLDATTQAEVKSGPTVPNVRGLTRVGETSRVLVHVQQYDAGAMALVGPSAVQMLDVDTGEVVTTWEGASKMGASPDGSRIALLSVEAKSSVQVVEVATGRVLAHLPSWSAAPGEDGCYGCHLAFSGDGSLLAISARVHDPRTKTTSSAVTVYDAKTGELMARADLGCSIDADGLALSIDRILCVAADANGLRAWRV